MFLLFLPCPDLTSSSHCPSYESWLGYTYFPAPCRFPALNSPTSNPDQSENKSTIAMASPQNRQHETHPYTFPHPGTQYTPFHLSNYPYIRLHRRPHSLSICTLRSHYVPRSRKIRCKYHRWEIRLYPDRVVDWRRYGRLYMSLEE